MRFILLSSLILLIHLSSYGQETHLIRSGQKLITVNNSLLKGNQRYTNQWFVRPAGGSYGTEDGTSYENAFDGWADISWADIKGGDILHPCGMIAEQCTVGASGTSYAAMITIDGSYHVESGIITGSDARTYGIFLNDKHFVRIQNITVNNATNSNIYVGEDCYAIRINNVIAHGSGNQSFQNEGTRVRDIEYNYCIAYDNVDDGMSGHTNSSVVVNNCTFYDNVFGIQTIATCRFVINNCIIYDNTTNIGCGTNSKHDINNCYIRHGIISATSTNTMTLRGCYIDSCEFNVSASGSGGMVIDRCYINRYYTGAVGIINPLTITNSLIVNNEPVSCSAAAAVLTAKNSIFKTSTDIYSININTALNATISNCTFIGTANVGRGVFANRATTVQNCIFYDLKNGLVAQTATGIITDNYNNQYDVTTPKSVSSGGVINTTNAITGDPKLNADGSLQAGSVAIGSGTNLGSPYDIAIYSATWQNLPIVTTKLQGASWNIGAFVNLP